MFELRKESAEMAKAVTPATSGGWLAPLAASVMLLSLSPGAMAETVDDARDALMQKDSDVTQETALEEVFQATEKQYSLLKAGDFGAYFGTSYSFMRDNRIDIAIEDSGITRFRIENDAEHSFGANLSLDYGIWNNLTFNLNFPVNYKYDTEKDINQAALGDIAFGLRYQPFPVKIGAPNTTLYTTFSTATGESPYDINVDADLSSGKGYYSLSAGVSMSQVIDPVVLFGSLGYTHAFDVTGVNQLRGTRNLIGVDTGDSISFSFGLAYALSYEVSFSASYQQSYSFQTTFKFDNDERVNSSDSTSSVVNMSLGLRTAKNNVYNVSFGFGLTEDSPDVMLGFSVPIDFTGFKPGA